MNGDISPSGSNIFDARLSRLLIDIGSWDEMIPLGARNLKWSEFKSHDMPSALWGSVELNSTNGGEALLAGSIASNTSSELLAHLVKLNAAVIIISESLVEASKLNPLNRLLSGSHRHTYFVKFLLLHTETFFRICLHERRLLQLMARNIRI